MRAAAEGCEVVVENAALVPVTRSSEAEYRSVNVDGCRTTLDAAEAAGAYVVRVSSSAIYGVPQQLPTPTTAPLAAFDPYGRSKAEAERMVAARREAGLAIASLRPRTLVGEGRLGLFDVIFGRVRAGKRVPIFGRGLNRSQLCDVQDLCSAVLAAIERRASGDYNVGSSGYATVREDIEALIAHAGTPASGAAGAGLGDPRRAAAARPDRTLAVHPVALGLGRRGLLPRSDERGGRPGLAAALLERRHPRELLRRLRAPRGGRGTLGPPPPPARRPGAAPARLRP